MQEGVAYKMRIKMRRRPNGQKYLVIYRKDITGRVHVEQCPLVLDGILDGCRQQFYICERTNMNIPIDTTAKKTTPTNQQRPILEQEVAVMIDQVFGKNKRNRVIKHVEASSTEIFVDWVIEGEGLEYTTRIIKSGDGRPSFDTYQANPPVAE